MNEAWRPFPENDIYLVSNRGRIVSTKTLYTRTHAGKLLTVRSQHAGNFLVGKKLSRKGYERVNLGGRTHQVHRVVALTWLPNPQGLPQVNHKDGNKQNNCVENLEWATNQENRAHAVKLGLHARGEAASHKLKEKQVMCIRSLCAAGIPQRKVAILFNVCQQTVSRIISRERWRHV